VKPQFQRIVLLLTQLAINALALVVVDAVFSRIWFDDVRATIAAAVLLALVNTYLRPLIMLLTLPFTVLTLGLFTILINAGFLKLVSWLIPDFHMDGFGTAVGAALVVSIISFLLNMFLQPHRLRVNIQRR
jgi:putative membrane protein